MRYKSTRGESPEVTFSEVLLGGLAPDGGLYMPEAFPQFSIQEIQSWSELSFDQLASKILFPFVKEEIDEDTFLDLLKDAYSTFDEKDVVKLEKLEDNRWVLELFHGPTLAFKDVAMQFIGNLYEYYLSKNDKKINIVVALSLIHI